MTTSTILTIVMTGATLVCMLIRPRGLSEAWYASIGALAFVVSGLLGPGDAWQAARSTVGVLGFLGAMMVISGIMDRAGIFAWVAEALARRVGERVLALYVTMFVLAAVVTLLMSLDVTIVMLTPVIFAMTSRRRLDPMPFLFACAFVANIGSLALPVSNLTNLLLVNQLDLQFATYVSVMWFPHLVALATTLAVFLVIFRSSLAGKIEIREEDLHPLMAGGTWRRAVAIGAMLVIAALLAFGFAERPLWIPAAIGALALGTTGFVTRRLTLQHLVSDISWPVFAFVIAMTMVVRAGELQVLADLTLPVADSPIAQVSGGVVAAAVASNVINNVPATVLIGGILQTMPREPATMMAYGTLVGANIGPAITTYGSIATMLWLTMVRKRGIDLTTRRYMRVSLITVPIVLVTTTLALMIVVTVMR